MTRSFGQKKSPARKLRTGVSVSASPSLSHHSLPVHSFRALTSECLAYNADIKPRNKLANNQQPHYFLAGPVNRNDFTTMLLGCWPTGIMVSREYSLGSSFRGFLFWITVTSPDCESRTRR